MRAVRLVACVVAVMAAAAVGARSVIPSPFEMQVGREMMTLKGDAVSVYTEDSVAAFMPLLCETMTGNAPIERVDFPTDADIRWLKDASIPDEGYSMVIDHAGITITASGNAGYIYAIQTLRQWGKPTKDGWQIPHGYIYDFPRAKWRGFMLDSGRQYQCIEVIKKYIDMASMLKMNRFHWHLTEGLGWRIEIKRYPELAQKGGFVAKGKEQQGYYTQEEIKELIRYAEARNVTIIPEIDFPGHAEAALSVFPELGCTGEPVEVPETGFTSNIFCAGKRRVREFLKDVLDEVCRLFPSPYIHLGGDEAPKANWDACPDCRQLIHSLGLAYSHALQRWLSAEMAIHLREKGKSAIFWEDVIHGDGYPLPDNVIIQWWNYRTHGNLAFRRALTEGYPIICNTNYYTYLNFPMTPWSGYGKERTFSLKDAYMNNPSDKALAHGSPLIMGMNCALWTDYGVTEDMLDRRLFPRIFALAQQMWHSGERLDYESLCRLIEEKKSWFESQGYDIEP